MGVGASGIPANFCLARSAQASTGAACAGERVKEAAIARMAARTTRTKTPLGELREEYARRSHRPSSLYSPPFWTHRLTAARAARCAFLTPAAHQPGVDIE